MEQPSLPTELILNHPPRSLGFLQLDWTPQPGSRVFFDNRAYTVLERHHRYQFKGSRYQLHKVVLHVQATVSPDEMGLMGKRWVIGDVTCRYNAHSEILRCTVNPHGPCRGCRDYIAR